MTTTAAYPATMADLRGHPTHSSMWSNYGGSVHMPGRVPDSIPSTATPLSGRPGSNHDVDHSSYPYSRYPQDDQEAYERTAHPELASHHGYPSLKRSFSEAEPPAYQEIVQDLRDDGSKMTVNHDHKLLAFKRAQDKITIVDQQGRIQQLELSAQLHGMFFLSEMPSSTADGTLRQPELTCYRRNLFQISGSLVTPRGQLSVITESGETVAVNNMEVTISAIESVDGNPVRLIVIPWKTPPPNSPETSQAPDQEPPSLPLIPFQDDGTESDGEYAVYPIGWRRLQFRIATANNGRRKELQQHFVLHLKVIGTLANASGTKVVLTESTTAPIVVRGRSPRNFQARKEIPLLGSSAGSRGQALVETGLGVVAGALTVKQHEARSRGLDGQLPRSAFTFSAPKLPGTQLGAMRSNSYPTWSSPSQVPMSQVPSSGPGNYPATTIGADPFPKLPLTGTGTFTAEPQELPLQTSMEPSVQLGLVTTDQTQPPIRPQYTYVHSTTAPPQLPLHTAPLSGHETALSIPRYVDNPRPTKSPRHVSQPSIRSASSIANESSPEYRYGSYASVNASPSDVTQPAYNAESSAGAAAPARDYYPSSGTWTTTAGEASSSVAYTNNDGRPYPFTQEQYKSTASGTSPAKTDSSQSQAPSVYSGGPRGSFDAMNQYSWSGN